MFSIHSKQLLAKMVLPLLVFLAVGLILLGLMKRPLVDDVRLRVADWLAPAYRVLVFPQQQINIWLTDLHGATNLTKENARLREENHNLRHWYDVAVALAAENARLKNNLHWIPEAAPQYVTGRVARDDGGPYSRAVLLDVGTGHNLHAGDIALDASGLLGRVTEIGPHTVRILLIDDDASRIPVTLSASHADAIMAGDDTMSPRLIYYPQDHHPIEGERVETRGQNSLPAGLPIGTVHYLAPNRPVVIPDANLERLDIVRVFDYGALDMQAPDAPGRVKVHHVSPQMLPGLFPSSKEGVVPSGMTGGGGQ
ncbi:rod shape-determining protein MreC [Swingsia samuiensis]|uniref:Cell shape-determining protein MreC n=1 Tax=Swingsia samuiensis TaxID=1293412 RepID=A0A4Y6ULD5_9PROT|nr:rod shape-determining protein MreC [Swingsia samuiensis]QDH17458.1 rod shape-determining protein MreC [Swingsia samuiensis]